MIYELLWENWKNVKFFKDTYCKFYRFIENWTILRIYFISVEFYFLVELELNIDPVFSKEEIKYLEIIVMIELIAYDAYAF